MHIFRCEIVGTWFFLYAAGDEETRFVLAFLFFFFSFLFFFCEGFSSRRFCFAFSEKRKEKENKVIVTVYRVFPS